MDLADSVIVDNNSHDHETYFVLKLAGNPASWQCIGYATIWVNYDANITFGCLAGVNYVALEDQKKHQM